MFSASSQSRADAAQADINKAYPSLTYRLRALQCDLSKDTVEQDLDRLLKQLGQGLDPLRCCSQSTPGVSSHLRAPTTATKLYLPVQSSRLRAPISSGHNL
ncbi:hypothetical protein GGR56DRAFT_415874 [Xylariaceae sp. FL0804]|nr:hypothetical protein GGR56DRAFT_415874 [Xylariaceae sp. FL0804]